MLEKTFELICRTKIVISFYINVLLFNEIKYKNMFDGGDVSLCVCVCMCVRACACARVRVCARACV